VCETVVNLAAAKKQEISSICVTTHGAAAALVDRNCLTNDPLVFPVMDYEFSGPDDHRKDYETVRPPFIETYSPPLPAGLNLGAQIYYLQRSYPEAFRRVTDILLYPQYWAWLFSGELSSELSSLGCHTDLWNGENKRFSSLVEIMAWEQLFPPIKPAWDVLGPIRPELAKQLGLPKECVVHTGVHDSNASLLRYLGGAWDKNNAGAGLGSFTVVSTGTWTIVMSKGAKKDGLDANRDMLCNTSVDSDLLSCSRSMGGREYQMICDQLGASVSAEINRESLVQVIESGAFALPNFCPGTGPFPNAKAKMVGWVDPKHGSALATLYCAMMIDVQLTLLEAEGSIIIEGSFLKNTWLCTILASLRKNQSVLLSADTTGTVRGCAQLCRWWDPVPELNLDICEAKEISGLRDYYERWKEYLEPLK